MWGEEGPRNAEPRGEVFPEFPKLTLASPIVADGQPDPAAQWSTRKDQWLAAAEKESRPIEKARLLLASANIILARELEPVCSQRIVDLNTGAPGNSAESTRTALEAAAGLITRARAALGPAQPSVTEPANGGPPKPEPNPAEAEKSDWDTLTHAADALQSFLDGQRAFLVKDDESGGRRRAASALAPLLEDPDRKVAAAARLWQALLRGVEPDPTAALQILGTSVSPPARDTWPFGLFARVERCRLLGAKGAWSSGLVQLIQMEDQLESCVPDMADRGNARRLFALARLSILKKWYESLRPDQSAERGWCAQQAEEIVKAYFSVDTSLLRLDPAIPEMVVVAPAGEQAAEPR